MTNGGGEPDSLEAAAGDLAQAPEGNGKLSAASIFRELMNLIDDHISYVLQMALHQLPRENRLKRFRCGDENVWWVRGLLPPIGLRRVAMADRLGQLRLLYDTLNAVGHFAI